MNKFTVKEPQVADLVKEAEKKIEEAANKGSDNELKETLAELKQEMKLYNDQIGAYNNSKMEYQANERNDKKYSDEDLAKAYLYAKTKGVPIHQTAIGETMMKAITSEAAFETGFTNTVQSELELNLKIAPLFRQIAVNQKTLQYRKSVV